MTIWNLVAAPAASKAAKDDEDPNQDLGTISLAIRYISFCASLLIDRYNFVPAC